MAQSYRIDTLVIGGGQAGLAAGYYLKKAGKDFLIFDASEHTGTTWRRRWDSLRLFTPSKFNALPGKQFMRGDFYFPSKEETADYLEAYVRAFDLPVQHNVTVDSVAKTNGSFTATAGGKRISANNVIVATGAYKNPVVPGFAKELKKSIVQLHSDEYKNADQLPPGPTLVVGAGNSGAEISMELAKAGHEVWLAGRDVGRIPAETLGRILGGHPYWLLLTRVISVKTPIGRKLRKQALLQGTPLIRLDTEKVVRAGVARTPKVRGVRNGMPLLQDGRVLDVKGIVWATGYRPDFSWIKLPIAGENGYPSHVGGVVPGVPGLYFVGLHFQTALASALIGGVGNDARIVVEHITGNKNRLPTTD